MKNVTESLNLIADDGSLYRPDRADFLKFAEEHTRKAKESRDISTNRLRVLAYESLAKVNPDFKKMLEKRRKLVPKVQEKSMSRLRELASRDRHRDLMVVPESKEESIRRLLPQLAPRGLKLHYDPQQLSTVRDLGISDLWDACTHEVHKPFYYPVWAEEEICPTGGFWLTWTLRQNNKVQFINYLCGDGGSDDVYCAHGARFWWYLVGENNETLRAFINFDLSGTCGYRLNDGDVGIWVLPEVTIKKGWGSSWGQLETVYRQDRWLNLWLATYDGPFVDGSVPNGDFSWNINPTPTTPFSFDISQGQRYIIQVDVQIALLASYNACIAMGEIMGVNFRKCSLRGDCVLCRCY